MERVTYFAYGSNLDARQMRSRCASAEAAARAVLPNHALAFGGFSRRWGGAVATVVQIPGAEVEGLLYRLTLEDLVELDRFEGCPAMYERMLALVTDEHGRRRRAQMYRQPAEVFVPWPPQPLYVRLLRHAYKRLDFDAKRIAAAMEVVR
jgi:gamma-glutamylcyclotransferase